MKRTNQTWTQHEISVLKSAYQSESLQPSKTALQHLTKAGYKRTLSQVQYKAAYCGFSRCKTRKVGTTRMRNGTLQEKQPNGEWVSLAHIVLNRNGVNIPDGSYVFHRDGDPLNNNIENLVIKTRAEHCRTVRAKDAMKQSKQPSTLDMLLQGKTPRMAGNNRMVWD